MVEFVDDTVLMEAINDGSISSCVDIDGVISLLFVLFGDKDDDDDDDDDDDMDGGCDWSPLLFILFGDDDATDDAMDAMDGGC